MVCLKHCEICGFVIFNERFCYECEKTRNYGYCSDYSDDFEWWNHEYCCEAEESEESAEKIYYKDRWEFVAACFTEQGCKDYLKANGHNLKSPRIFACGSYRNEEYRKVRQALIEL